MAQRKTAPLQKKAVGKAKMIMNLIVFIFSFNLFFPQFVFANDTGWTDVKWGMTEDEILKKYPQSKKLERIEKYEGLYVPIIIEFFPAGGQVFKVEFQMDDKIKRLVQVRLTPYGYEKHRSLKYYSLKEKLSLKYGLPIFVQEADFTKLFLGVQQVLNKVIWRKGQNLIILSYIGNDEDGIAVICYRPYSESELDNL